jgi:hypothetical protein
MPDRRIEKSSTGFAFALSHGTIEDARFRPYKNGVVSRGNHDLLGFGERGQVSERFL